MNVARNTLLEGMDQDTSITHYKNTKYWKAENLRLFTSDGLSIGSLQNESGNTLSFKFPDSTLDFYRITTTNSSLTWGGTISINGQDITIATMEIGKIGSYLAGYNITSIGTPSSTSTIPYFAYRIGTTCRLINRHGTIVICGSNIGALGVTLTQSSGTGSLSLNSYNWSEQTIIGYTNLRDRLVLFTTDKDNVSTTPTNTTGAIWSVRYNSSNTVIDLDTGYLTIDDHLVYYGSLNFSKANMIRAKAYHFNENVGKIYWTDNYNKLRHLNIYDPTSICLTEDQLDLVGGVTFSKPRVTEVIQGGGYKVGAVQYAYQLYNLYGAETSISPVSFLCNLSSDIVTQTTSKLYGGNPIGDNSGKAVRVSIPFIDDRYDHIRVFSLHFSTQDDIPIVRVVVDKKVSKNASIDVIDDGINHVGEISFQEFRAVEKLVFSCRDIELKDKRLVVGNINESKFDVTYDARAYRHDSTGKFSVDGMTAITGNDTNWGTITSYADCVPGTYSTYKYKQNGTTLGAEGINISYEFSVQQLPICPKTSTFSNSNPKTNQSWTTIYDALGDNDFSNNSYYGSYASPINSGQMIGYKRGETYRFGIVFYSNIGQRSPVKWIGDIRIPTVDEMTGTSAVTYSSVIMKSITSPSIPIIEGATRGQFYVNPTTFSGGNYVNFTICWGSGTAISKKFSIEPLVYAEISNEAPIFGTQQTTLFKDVALWIKSLYGDEVTVSLISDSVNNIMKIMLTSTVYNYTLDETVNKVQLGTGTNSAYSVTTSYATTTSISQATYGITGVDSSERTVANVIYPVFTIDNIPVDSNYIPYSYEIVRVNREEKDKSIIMQGLVFPTIKPNNTYFPVTSIDGILTGPANSSCNAKGLALRSSTRVNLISPEVNFRSTEIKDGDSLDLIGAYNTNNWAVTYREGLRFVKTNVMTNFTAISRSITSAGIIKAPSDYNDESNTTVIGSDYFGNVIRGTKGANGGTNLYAAGTSAFLVLPSAFSHATPTYDGALMVGEVKRAVVNQYGGNTYYARQNNIYIGCNAFINPTTTTSIAHVFGGDIYISHFEYLRAMYNDTNRSAEIISFPIETSINLDYRYDKCYSKFIENGGVLAHWVQEKAGDYSGKVGEDGNYKQDYDLYLENPVYSRSNNSQIFLPDAPDTDYVSRRDTQIFISEPFNYDDLNDNLIKFLPENNTILNTEYGNINALVNYKDYLYVFQDKAIGVQFINERTVLNDTTGSSLAIGSGDVAGRIQYITLTSGCQHPNSIVVANTGLYYFDSISRAIYIVSEENMNVTLANGLSKYFNAYVTPNLADTQLLGYGIHGIYDDINHRILWNYRYSSTSFTLSYNEVVKSFESFYTYYPSMYIKTFDNKVLSTNSSSYVDVYLHGGGEYADYYGTKQKSTLQLVVNDEPLVNKQFISIEFPFRVTKAGLSPGIATDTYYDDPLDNILFSNNYQTTASLALVQTRVNPTSITQIEAQQHQRKWRLAVPRVSETTTLGTRYNMLSDVYLSITMEYINTDNRKIQFEDILTYYTPSAL